MVTHLKMVRHKYPVLANLSKQKLIFIMTTLKAYTNIYRHDKNSKIKYWVIGFFISMCIILFLPWTQNVRAKGNVTTLRQEQRPQELNSILPGKIVKWYVKEGDAVKAGDTILQISEIKDEYFDPNLVTRTGQQIGAKQLSVDYYKNKVTATQNQIGAIESGRDLKQSQLQNKITQLQIKLLRLIKQKLFKTCMMLYILG